MTDEVQYGRRVWQLLHSMAAYYPEEPSEVHQKAAKDFVNIFMKDGIEYPEWGDKFMKDSKGEVDVSSRENFSVWVCLRHNDVNKRLGKPEFSCHYPDLIERWGPPGYKPSKSTDKQ